MIMSAIPATTPPPPAPDGDAGRDGVATPPTSPHRGRPKKAHPHLVPRLVAAGVVLAIATGVALLLRPKPIEVEIAVATVGPLRATVDADAVTRVRNRFTIAAPVAGMVYRIDLSEGDVVRAGQVVARIAPAPVHEADRRVALAKLDAVRASVLQADQHLLTAKNALDQARRDDRRARMLLAAGAMSPHDAELAALTLATRHAELEVARAQQRVARDELAQARAAVDAMMNAAGTLMPVHAPASGRVLRIPERSARVVTAGEQLLELGDPGSIEVAADVLSSDAASVRAGQDVELLGWGGAPLHGVVRRVEPSARTRISALGVEEQRLNVIIDLSSVPATLGDGYRLDARIVVWSAPRVLNVPAGALLRSDAAWGVFAVRRGRAARETVRIGHLSAGAAEVLGGLRRGDSVIVFAPDALEEGTRVKAARESVTP